MKIDIDEKKEGLVAKKARMVRLEQRVTAQYQKRLFRVDQKRFCKMRNDEGKYENYIPSNKDSQSYPERR